MFRAIPYEILIGFIVNVVDATVAAEVVDLPQNQLRINLTGWIVGRNGNDRTSAASNGIGDGIDARPKLLIGRNHHAFAAGDADRHLVIEVIRREENNLFASAGDGENPIDKT